MGFGWGCQIDVEWIDHNPKKKVIIITCVVSDIHFVLLFHVVFNVTSVVLANSTFYHMFNV